MEDLEYELEKQRENIALEVKHKIKDLERVGKKITYDNQIEAALEILTHYINGKYSITLIAQPGTGKTGTVFELMKQLGLHNDIGILSKNMIVCSGMSDIDWEKQFADNLINSFKSNVFHRSNLSKNIDLFSSLKKGLVVTDECHIANGTKMILGNTLKNAGLLDITILENRDVRMLDVSATPEGILEDSTKWGEKSARVILKPGPDYKGFQVMLEEERIKKSPLFEKYEDVFDFLKMFDDRYKNTTRKYFPFRINDPQISEWLIKASIKLDWHYPIEHNSENRVDFIDDKMKQAPSKHQIIQVKGFWRASKRLIRKHVGGSYEAILKKRDTTGTSQSLTARFCDNYKYEGDYLDVNLRPLHYCDLDAIKEYLNWFNKGCSYRESDYTCPRLKSKNGRIKYRKTKLNPENINGLVYNEEEQFTDITEIGPYDNLNKIKTEIKEFFKNLDRKVCIKDSWKPVGDIRVSTRCQPIHGKEFNDLKECDRILEKEFIEVKDNKRKYRKNLGLSQPTNIYAIFPVYKEDNTLVWYARYYNKLKPKKEKKTKNIIIQN